MGRRKRTQRTRRPPTPLSDRAVRYTLKSLKASAASQVQLDLPLRYQTPKVRGHCENTIRPCPYISCRYHLALEVCHDGSLRFPHGHEPEDLKAMAQTCSLDVSDEGGRELGEVADHLGLSRQRTAKLEMEALEKLARAIKSQNPTDLIDRLPILRKKFAAMSDGARPRGDGTAPRYHHILSP